VASAAILVVDDDAAIRRMLSRTRTEPSGTEWSMGRADVSHRQVEGARSRKLSAVMPAG